jgi:hypothetical protein
LGDVVELQGFVQDAVVVVAAAAVTVEDIRFVEGVYIVYLEMV